MDSVKKVLVVDDCLARACKVADLLSSQTLNVRTQRSVVGVLSFEGAELALVHDNPGNFSRASILVERAKVPIPMVAYRKGPKIEHVVNAVRAGAVDYLEWPTAQHRARERITDLIEARVEYAQTVSQAEMARRRVSQLSARETQVLNRLAQGCSNKIIARDLGISHRTVEIHRANMIAKLDCDTSAGAIRMRIEANLS